MEMSNLLDVLIFVIIAGGGWYINQLINSTTENGIVLISGLNNRGVEQDIVVEHIYPPKYPSHPKIKVI